MLPNTNIPFDESIAAIADTLKRSEMYVDLIRTELIEKGNLSNEGDVIIKSIVSKLDQASEMSSIDKFKNWYDSDYIKDTIKERIKDEREQELLLKAFDSLKDSLIQSASVTSILSGQIRKSIGSFAGLFTSQMDLPPIVTFMTTRIGDAFGSFLQRRKEAQERRDALNRKLDDAIADNSKPEQEPKEPEEQEKPKPVADKSIPTKEQIEEIRESVSSSAQSLKVLESELKKNLGLESSINDDIVDTLVAQHVEVLEGIQEGIDEIFNDPQIAGALRQLGESLSNPEVLQGVLEKAFDSVENQTDTVIERISEVPVNQEPVENVSDKEEQESYQRETLEALQDIAENTETTSNIKEKERTEGIFGKLFSGLMTGISATFSSLGKLLSAIIPSSITGLVKSLIPSLASIVASPTVIATVAAGSYLLFNKYANEHNTELDRAGLAAANPDEIQNSTSTDPNDVLNEKGQEELKNFTEKNKFSEMSISDQIKMGFARIFGDEDTVKEITDKYKTDHFATEEQKSELYKKQSLEAQETYSKIDLIPHISVEDLEKYASSNINILELDRKQIEELVDRRLGTGAAAAISPTSVATTNTSINTNNVVNQSTFVNRPMQLMDPQTHAAMGSSLR